MEDLMTQHQYLLNYFDSLQILETAQNSLRRAATSPKLDDEARAEAAAAYLDITNQIAHFTNVHEAVMRKFTGVGVKPPGKDVVDKTQELETKLGKQIARAETHQALLKVVTDFVGKWATLATPDGGTVAGTDPAKTKAPDMHLAFLGK
jgi:hypothetical protein